MSAPRTGGRARNQALADQRARQALAMRLTEGKTWKQIGDAIGISPQGAKDAYHRGCMLDMPRDEIHEARQMALAKYDIWEQIAIEILHTEHPLVSWGRLVPGMTDDAPRLQALDRLIKIEQRRAAIQGYEAPKRKELFVVSESMVDQEIRRLEEELGLNQERQHADA